ncbi:MAG: hypothetical protein GTO09_10480, partial [Candidatus Latescibacteria bacterium]|nr:hypothetical protein [Candidatus Latescibacterota bacterium]
VSDVIRLFKEAKNIESDSRDDAEESEEFYRGEQWTTEQINKLESEHRSYLTFNHIQANVKLLSGYQRQNRTDLRFFPIEDGDARVADVLNIITKVILDNNGFDVEETLCFEDVLISGRGFIELLVDYSENYNGDIIVEHFPWADVYMGPHIRPDAKDCEYMVKAKWFSKAKVKQAWPDKADDIQTEWDFYADPERKTQLEIPGENYVHSDNIEPRSGGLLPDGELMDIAKKNIRVLECWRKEFRRIFILANPEDDFFHSAEGWSDEDVKKAKTIPGFFAIPKHTHAMRKTTLAARTMLDDDYPDVSFNDFSLIPIYADKKGPHFWGKVEVGKDPQRETNKR